MICFSQNAIHWSNEQNPWLFRVFVGDYMRPTYVGGSLNGGTPKTPQHDHFSWENQWLLGTTILGNPHVGIKMKHYKYPVLKQRGFNGK